MRLRCPASARGVELVRGGAGRSGVAVPQELRAGRVARAPKPPAEAPDQPDGIAEGAWVAAACAGEGGEHAQLAIREQQFARQVGHLAPELDHQLDPPPDDHLAGHGPFESLGRDPHTHYEYSRKIWGTGSS